MCPYLKRKNTHGIFFSLRVRVIYCLLSALEEMLKSLPNNIQFDLLFVWIGDHTDDVRSVCQRWNAMWNTGRAKFKVISYLECLESNVQGTLPAAVQYLPEIGIQYKVHQTKFLNDNISLKKFMLPYSGIPDFYIGLAEFEMKQGIYY